MKNIFFLIGLFFFLTQAVFAQELESTKEVVFKPGEELKYRLRYGFITAAEATLKVEDTDVKFKNRSAFHLIAHGRTSGSFDVFYKVRNRYDSYIDSQELLPYLHIETIREGKYRRDDKVNFDHEQRKIVSSRKGTFAGKPKTFDLLSAYYFSRTLNMDGVKAGQKFTINYFLKDEVASLEIQYIGKEKIKTALGYVNCLKFSPTVQPGRIFRKDSKLYLWVTDDNNRIPVKAQVEILVGAVTMELVSASNLKYPLLLAKN